MAVALMRWDDTGAPSLSGTAGAVITLLDALLVNGYNSQTVTSITRSGSVATVTKTAHGFRDGAYLIHSGAGESEYNVAAYITRIDANSYSYTVAGSPATPATGTISARVAELGWGKTYSGTNKAVYRAASGLRHYLRVEDNNGHGSGNAYCGVRGYETMSDVDTGTGPFPTTSQVTVANSLFRKSNTADATNRPWILIGDSKRFYLWTGYAYLTTDTLASHGQSFGHGMFFGELKSYLSGDAYHTLITVSNGASSFLGSVNAIASYVSGHYMPRVYTQTGTSVQVSKIAGVDYAGNTLSMGASQIIPFPDPISGGMLLHECQIWEYGGSANTYSIRGKLPGIWNPLHNFPLENGAIFDGSGETAGKKFLMLNMSANGNNGRVAFEISNTWDI